MNEKKQIVIFLFQLFNVFKAKEFQENLVFTIN